MTQMTFLELVDELRLVEREDGGSTRERGSDRAEALRTEIERRWTEACSYGHQSFASSASSHIIDVLDGRV